MTDSVKTDRRLAVAGMEKDQEVAAHIDAAFPICRSLPARQESIMIPVTPIISTAIIASAVVASAIIAIVIIVVVMVMVIASSIANQACSCHTRHCHGGVHRLDWSSVCIVGGHATHTHSKRNQQSSEHAHSKQTGGC